MASRAAPTGTHAQFKSESALFGSAAEELPVRLQHRCVTDPQGKQTKALSRGEYIGSYNQGNHTEQVEEIRHNASLYTCAVFTDAVFGIHCQSLLGRINDFLPQRSVPRWVLQGNVNCSAFITHGPIFYERHINSPFASSLPLSLSLLLLLNKFDFWFKVEFRFKETFDSDRNDANSIFTWNTCFIGNCGTQISLERGVIYSTAGRNADHLNWRQTEGVMTRQISADQSFALR